MKTSGWTAEILDTVKKEVEGRKVKHIQQWFSSSPFINRDLSGTNSINKLFSFYFFRLWIAFNSTIKSIIWRTGLNCLTNGLKQWPSLWETWRGFTYFRHTADPGQPVITAGSTRRHFRWRIWFYLSPRGRLRTTAFTTVNVLKPFLSWKDLWRTRWNLSSTAAAFVLFKASLQEKSVYLDLDIFMVWLFTDQCSFGFHFVPPQQMLFLWTTVHWWKKKIFHQLWMYEKMTLIRAWN